MSGLTVPAAEFKAKCLALIDRVRDRGEPITITKRGRVVARLVPVGLEDERPGWRSAAMAGGLATPSRPRWRSGRSRL